MSWAAFGHYDNMTTWVRSCDGMWSKQDKHDAVVTCACNLFWMRLYWFCDQNDTSPAHRDHIDRISHLTFPDYWFMMKVCGINWTPVCGNHMAWYLDDVLQLCISPVLLSSLAVLIWWLIGHVVRDTAIVKDWKLQWVSIVNTLPH